MSCVQRRRRFINGLRAQNNFHAREAAGVAAGGAADQPEMSIVPSRASWRLKI